MIVGTRAARAVAEETVGAVTPSARLKPVDELPVVPSVMVTLSVALPAVIRILPSPSRATVAPVAPAVTRSDWMAASTSPIVSVPASAMSMAGIVVLPPELNV